MFSIFTAGSINSGPEGGNSQHVQCTSHTLQKKKKKRSLLKKPVGKAHRMVSGAGDLVQLIPGDPSQHLHIIHLLLLPFLSFLLYFNAKLDTPFGKRHSPGLPTCLGALLALRSGRINRQDKNLGPGIR